MLSRYIVCIFLALTFGPSLSGADFVMKVTDKNYLDTQGFSVFLYDSTYHPVFVDQKNTAMEMILHGQRIATNGDVRLMPTPEQWAPSTTTRSLKAKRISPHTIRHSTACHLLRAGVDINTIRGWLGHVSLDTTHVYAEVDLEMKAKALAHCDIPAGTRSRHQRKDTGVIEFLKSL